MHKKVALTQWLISPTKSGIKNPPANAGDAGNASWIPGSERSPGEGNTTHSSILAWRICGQRSLVGYSLWDHKESDITEGLSARTYQVLTRMQCKSTLTVLWKTMGKQ